MNWAAVPLDSREKKIESRMTVAKSAIVAPAITSCPNVDPTWPASFNTATTTPSEVADSTIAMKSGCDTRSPALKPSPITIAIRNETAKPSSDSQRLPAQLHEVDLEARQEEQGRQADQ
jgi:hypothetical protein